MAKVKWKMHQNTSLTDWRWVWKEIWRRRRRRRLWEFCVKWRWSPIHPSTYPSWPSFVSSSLNTHGSFSVRSFFLHSRCLFAIGRTKNVAVIFSFPSNLIIPALTTTFILSSVKESNIGRVTLPVGILFPFHSPRKDIRSAMRLMARSWRVFRLEKRSTSRGAHNEVIIT